jgi:hypothetical protein
MNSPATNDRDAGEDRFGVGLRRLVLRRMAAASREDQGLARTGVDDSVRFGRSSG